MSQALPNTPKDRAEMIEIKRQQISVLASNRAVLLANLQILEENLEAYTLAENAGIQELAQTIQKIDTTIELEAKALFHLQSAQSGRPAPGSHPAAAPPARASAPASPAPPPRVVIPMRAPAPAPPAASSSTLGALDPPVTQDELDYWRAKAERGEAGLMPDIEVINGKQRTVMRPIRPDDIPDLARAAEGFDTKHPPDDATLEGIKRTKKVAQWEVETDSDFSAADEIDERGYRHVINGKRHRGRHRIFDQTGRLVSDVPIDVESGEDIELEHTPTDPPPAPSILEGANGATQAIEPQ